MSIMTGANKDGGGLLLTFNNGVKVDVLFKRGGDTITIEAEYMGENLTSTITESPDIIQIAITRSADNLV